MNILNSLQQHWLSNVRADVLSAMVVALVLIAEAIAFSIIAGVDPKVGLYASFAIAVITAFAGGRPAMISAATGAMALVTKAVPSPLVCILVLTAIALYVGIEVRTVSDMGELPDSLPLFLWPKVPLTFETLQIIFPYSLALALVGLLESLMTATIVDDLTDTNSNKNRECVGQGIANIGSGLLGGMAGCAMIGQSMIHVKSGGRTRLSTLLAGVLLLCFAVYLPIKSANCWQLKAL